MKTLMITGDRKTGYNELRELEDRLHEINAKEGPHTLITGGADGPDTNAAITAEELGWEVITYKPNYKKHGRGAPLKRNDEMIAETKKRNGRLLAYQPHGRTNGTNYTINAARKAGIPIELRHEEGTSHENPKQLELW